MSRNDDDATVGGVEAVKLCRRFWRSLTWSMDWVFYFHSKTENLHSTGVKHKRRETLRYENCRTHSLFLELSYTGWPVRSGATYHWIQIGTSIICPFLLEQLQMGWNWLTCRQWWNSQIRVYRIWLLSWWVTLYIFWATFYPFRLGTPFPWDNKAFDNLWRRWNIAVSTLLPFVKQTGSILSVAWNM